MHFCRIVFLIATSIAVVGGFVLANDQVAVLQTESPVCVSPLLQDRVSNHLQEIELFAAIMDGDHSAVRKALQAGTDSSTISNSIYAIYKTSEPILNASNPRVKAVNPKAVFIPKPDDTLLDRFFYTRKNGTKTNSLISSLLDKLFNVHGSDNDTEIIELPALHIAVVMGNPHIVKLLLEAHADTKTIDKQYNLTALSFLCCQGRVDDAVDVELMVESFIEAGSNSNEVANAFHYAAMTSNVIVAAALVKEAKEFIPDWMLTMQRAVPLRDRERASAYNSMLQQLMDMRLIEPEP